VASSSFKANAQVTRQPQGRLGRPVQLRGPVKLPASITTAVSGDQGDLKIFFAAQKGRTASVLVIKASDADAVKMARDQLRATPASARVVNGVIQVNLGAAAEGRCNVSGIFSAAAIDFGDPPPVDVGPITRG